MKMAACDAKIGSEYAFDRMLAVSEDTCALSVRAEDHGTAMDNLHKSPEILALEEQLRKQTEQAQKKPRAHANGKAGFDVICLNELEVPTLPAATVLLIEMCHDINVSYPKLSKIIQADPGLSVRILRLANSAYYAQSTPVSSIVRALTVLGINEVRTIGLSYKLMKVIKDFVDDSFDFAAYWEQSLLMAVMAKEIANEMTCPLADEAFLGGLLQNIGIIILQCNKPTEYEQVTQATAGDPDTPVVKIEQQVFGTSHAKIGAEVCTRWKFPQPLTEAIRYHHTPMSEVVAGDHDTELRGAAYAASMMPSFLTGSQPVRILDDLESRGILEPGALGPVLVRAHEALQALRMLFDEHSTHDAQVADLMLEAADRIEKLGASQLETCRPPE